MKRPTIIFFIFFIFQSCKSQDNSLFHNQENIMAIVFSDNSSSRQSISLEKAILDESSDKFGWINRLENNQFGLPEFNEEMKKKFSKYRDSLYNLEKDNYLNTQKKDSLFFIKTKSVVDNFFLDDDKNLLKRQINSAKRGNWDSDKYSAQFSDSKNATRISEPYFNKTFDKAVVFLIYSNLEQANFYRKINGRWEFYFSSLLWIE